MRKFLSFVAVASLSVVSFAQEAVAPVSPSDMTITSQPTPSVAMPATVVEPAMMMQAAGCGCGTTVAAPASDCGCCATTQTCCPQQRTRVLNLRSRRNNNCCNTGCNTCCAPAPVQSCGCCAAAPVSTGCCATAATCCPQRNRLVNLGSRRNNTCCNTGCDTGCSTCAAAPAVASCGCPAPVSTGCCAAPVATTCCEQTSVRGLRAQPARTRLLGRRNNCGC